MSGKPQLTPEQQALYNAISTANIDAFRTSIASIPANGLHFQTVDGTTPLTAATMGNSQIMVIALLAHTNWTQEERDDAIGFTREYAFNEELAPEQFQEVFNLIGATQPTNAAAPATSFAVSC